MTASIRRYIVARSRQVIHDQVGQTTVETLMIVGLMAAVIVAVFTATLWPSISSSVSQLVGNVSDSVSGSSIR
jgi:Flp pilus assembly pilin Flp